MFRDIALKIAKFFSKFDVLGLPPWRGVLCSLEDTSAVARGHRRQADWFFPMGLGEDLQPVLP
jgi:hypothetical protein